MSASSLLSANPSYSNDGGATDVRRSLVATTVEAPSPELQSADSLDPENNSDYRVLLPAQESNEGAVFEDDKPMISVLEKVGGASGDHQEQVHVMCSEKCALKSQTGKKKPRRRGGNARKNKAVLNCYPIENREKKGHWYSRKEMEVLRFQGVEEQKKKWVEVYCGLGPLVQREYDELVKSEKTREEDSFPSFDFDFDPRPQFQKSADLSCSEIRQVLILILIPWSVFKFNRNNCEGCPQLLDNHSEDMITSDPSSCLPISDEIGFSALEGEYSEDDESDDDYSSIQRPAFLVTGEPDFDSGPPQDGLEYLRRVRWEADRIPKVKVVKVNKNKEQSVYMPQIPDIMECPENILPLKQWENSFLADFSELRQAFSRLDPQASRLKSSTEEHLSTDEDDILGQMLEINTSVGKFVNLTIEDDSKTNPHSPENSNFTDETPTLSKILKMDFAARISMLKRRISCIENMSTLTRDESLWLFALCVAVDWPLDASTSAALRSLLRKCASLRAGKKEVDDEVAILNILVTISGRYFGQLES
ncbi:survival of motor neuron protein-interacting protein [Striga asiatica]|uniref:Survival of motor neuron protein-interacting protein n=1 Tax=Striga asiatica TaxID=4170 RepID=A0A5A7P531_STRAF|nr:survival of motor neuron protein-interacting protein [Striga asiatica]